MSTSSGRSTPPAPSIIDPAARAVAASLTALTGRPITFRSWAQCPDLPQQYAVDFDATGETLRVFAFDDSVPSSVMAMLNDLTDLLAERYWGEPIPPCPDHPHPARPVCDEQGVVIWVCPRDGHVVRQLWPAPES